MSRIHDGGFQAGSRQVLTYPGRCGPNIRGVLAPGAPILEMGDLGNMEVEAEFLSEGREEQPPAPVTDRFLVRKLGRDFLVRVGEIDWVEASGNYVNLYVGKRAYPLRETMIGIEQRLEPHGFLRVHRSAIVNLERIKALVPGEAGDGAVQLQDEQEVPVSGRYRKALRERVQA